MKNKQNKKRIFEILLIFGILLINFSLINAMGFSTAFDDSYPFVIAPGETKDMSVTLSSTDPLKVGVTLTSGSEIATISDTEYDLGVGEMIPVNLKIEIPDNVAEGTKYKISLLARDITPAGGTVSLAGEVGVSFTVLVQKPAPVEETPAPVEEEGISTIWWVLGIIVIIAIIAIIWFVVKNRKEE